MTEAEWLAGSEPGPMLDHLGDQASDRKLRLFACAVGRRHEAQVGTARFREVLELAERYADGETTGDEMTAWAGGAVTAGRNRVEDHARAVAYWITRPGESMRTAARVAIQ